MKQKDIDKYKKALGKSGDNLTNDQIISCVQILRQMASVLVEEYLKTNNETK